MFSKVSLLAKISRDLRIFNQRDIYLFYSLMYLH
jgi:hypothetical protein